MHNLDNFVLLLKTFSNPDIKKFLDKSGNGVNWDQIHKIADNIIEEIRDQYNGF